jgi:ribosomal protein L22
MAEEKKTTMDEKTEENGEKKMEKTKEKVEDKKIEKKDAPKKDIAIANGYSLKISPKQSVYICRIIRGKSPEAAIGRLQAVIDEKRPVPMAGLEVGHKKGKGLAGGKFPKNACRVIIDVVKQVGANAAVNGIETPIITIARSDRASAPYRKAGRRAKRTHLHIEVKDKPKLAEKAAQKK